MAHKHRKLEIVLTSTTTSGIIIEDRFRIYPCRHVHYNCRILTPSGVVALPWTRKDKRIRKSDPRDQRIWNILESMFGSKKGASRACRRGNQAAAKATA